MSEQKKETIYIDIDDEITGIIDKVISSKNKVVALVLPKRATVMQSIVNMRLLKRSSDEAGKSLVLITSEASVLPLAGTVGLYTAKTLQSKPKIPNVEDEDVIEEKAELVEEDEPEIDETKPVGELAGAAVVASAVSMADEEEAIEVDNEDKELPESKPSKDDKKKPKKDKKLKIPNFDSFRKKLFIGLGVFIILAVGWYVAFYVMPKATITIKTDTTTSAVDVTFTASPAAKTVDVENKIVPAKTQETKKTATEKAATTGEKNLGEKASGDVTLSLIDCSEAQVTIPAGSTISSGSLNFITQESATLSRVLIGNSCKNSSFPDVSTAKVKVIAQNGGNQYNLSSRNYAVAGHTSVVGQGDSMTGGTDKIVKIVSQQDVDTAKNKALESNVDAVKSETAAELTKQGYLPITETFNNSEPVVTSTPNVGDEANEVSVTIVTTYTMLGANKDDVQKLVEAEAKKSIDTSKQSITDYGLDSAVYQVYEVKPDGQARLNLKTTVTAGTQLNADEIKAQSAGKRRGEIQEELSQIPGVKDVEVSYKPFWVTKTTKNKDKITVVIENEGK